MGFVDDETQVEVVGTEPTSVERPEAPEAIEFDYGPERAPEDTQEVEALTSEEGRGATIPGGLEEDEDGPEGVGVTDNAILARIEAAERAAAEAQNELARIRGAAPEAREDGPPKPENEITTVADIVNHMRWEMQRAMRDMNQTAAASASQAASEQRARGLLNVREMGAGFDYDSIVSRHIAPIEKINPRAAQLFASQRDPALVRYAMGLVLAAIEKHGEPVKAFKQLRRAVDGNIEGGAEVVKKIQKAERTGAARVATRRGTPGPSGTRAITAAQIDAMSPREFNQFKADLRAGRVRQAE